MANHFTYTINSLIETLEDIASWHKLDEGHGLRTSIVSIHIAQQMENKLSPDDLMLLGYAARIHDLGRIGVSDEIMTKAGPLTLAERGAVETHVELGYQFLVRSGLPLEIKQTVLYHHERWDGSGYPNRLQGVEIPLFARIVAIADMWDALISVRPYRRAMSFEKALEVMNGDAHTFDPYLYSLFLKVLQEEERI